MSCNLNHVSFWRQHRVCAAVISLALGYGDDLSCFTVLKAPFEEESVSCAAVNMGSLSTASTSSAKHATSRPTWNATHSSVSTRIISVFQRRSFCTRLEHYFRREWMR
eukprot:m.570442 g.570442  ORF g.570442 m.570442 type:complete len:108 (-) comp22263_c3_seq22:3499-3822(-)